MIKSKLTDPTLSDKERKTIAEEDHLVRNELSYKQVKRFALIGFLICVVVVVRMLVVMPDDPRDYHWRGIAIFVICGFTAGNTLNYARHKLEMIKLIRRYRPDAG